MIFKLTDEEEGDLEYNLLMFRRGEHSHVYISANTAQNLLAYHRAEKYRNLGTVCVALLPIDDGLLLIRRGRKSDPGYGMLALPGGFQKGNIMQNMWDAVVEEVFEETGLMLSKDDFNILNDSDTDTYEHNVLFFEHSGLHRLGFSAQEIIEEFKPSDDEVLELVHVTEPIETAFPFHTRAIANFFARKRNTSKEVA